MNEDGKICLSFECIIIRDFNLIIFFYNSLRSVIYIANSIEIFFGSVVLYGV